MSKRPYQHLPPLEHRPDGSPYRITPPQKRRASGLIRRECCNCEDGNCLALDDGDTCAPTIKYVRERAKAGGKVYSYLFDQDFPLMGKSTPWHCADIPFVFHNTGLVPVCAFEGAQRLEAEIFGAVMQFARTGAPGWAASTEDVEQTMLFGPQSRLVQNHDHALIEALAPFTDLRMKKATRAGGQIQH